MLKIVYLYTDGACSGNPGPGGWGALLRCGKTEKTVSGYEAETTNNRMELMAAIGGLRALKERCHVVLTTESQNVKKGMTEWIIRWKQNQWKTANKQPVKNVDLWQQLEEQCERHEIEWHWIKGHSGHPENERADELARQAICDKLS